MKGLFIKDVRLILTMRQQLIIFLAVCALIWNPYHLLTAALLLLVSRAKWNTDDIATLDR